MDRLTKRFLSGGLALALPFIAAGRVFAGFNVLGSTVTFAPGEELRTSAVAVSAAGVLNGGGARLYVEGDWLNAGVFNAQGSTAVFINAAAASTIAGNNAFYSLAISSPGKTVYFTAGSTQTVAGVFSAAGAPGSLVRLRSTADGSKWAIGFTGGQQLVTYLDVKDSSALYNPVRAHHSADSGNNNANWVWGPAIANNQASPTPWYSADPGAVFNVDFSDLVGFTTAQYRVTSGPAGGGTVIKGWTDIYANPAGTTSFTADWAVDFAALEEGLNYVSVRVFDTVGFSSSAADAFVIRKDAAPPAVIDNQAGDNTWRSAAGTLYNVDFADDGSGVASAQYKVTSQPAGGGAVVLDWTDIVAATSTALYSPDWGVDFAALPSGATSYVSVRAYDLTGKSTTYYDAFYVRKDVDAPWIVDNQPDDVWRFADPGAIYDVDFADAGGSRLDRAQYSVSSSPVLADGGVKGWTDIAANISSDGYAQNWGVDFAACRAGVNYVSVRVYDNAGNYSQGNDVFSVKKDTSSPVITDNQAGDDVWRNAAGTLYDVDFADALSGLATAQYRVTSQPGQTGAVLKDWTDIYSNPAGTPAYTDNWQLDFAAMRAGGGNYVSVRAYDMGGRSAITPDVFYVKKDTVPPSAAITAFTASGTDLALTGDGADGLSGVGGYSFWISPQPDFSAEVSSTAYSASQTALFSGVQEAVTYYARLYVRDNALNAAYSVNASTLTRGVVHVSSQSLAPAAAMQGAEAAMLSVDLRTNPGRSATLNRLTITKGTSTASSSDISAVRVYKDINGDGALDGGDPLLGSGVFSGVNAAVTLSIPLTVTATASRVIVSYVFSSGAAADATAKAEIASPSGLVFPDPYAAAGDFPLGSGFTRITDGPNTLNITPVSAAPSVAPPGTANIGMIRLQMQTNTGTSVVDKLHVSLGGTVASNNVPFVKVYRDANGNAQFDPVGDALLSSGVDIFTDLRSTITLTGSAANRTVGTTPVYMFVVADAASDAPEGSSFSIAVATSSSFTLANPADTPVMVPETFTSGSVTIQTDNSANINIVSVAPAQMTQGQLYAVALASCSVNVGIAELNRIRVNRIGSSVDSDIRSVRVYKDQIQDGGPFNQNFDLLLGSAPVVSGVATVNITTVTLTAGTTVPLFIVYEVSPTATGGNTLGAGFSNNTYFRMASPNTAVYGNFPFNTGTGVVQVTINPLRVLEAQPVATGEVFQGTVRNAFIRLKVRSELNPVLWSSLRVKKTGTAPDSYVTRVNLYRDSNGDGELDAGDERVTSGNNIFVGGETNMSFASQQSVDSAGGTYFVALDISADAADATVGVEISTTNWLAVNSPNFVSPASVAAPYVGGPVAISQYPNIVTVSTAGIVPNNGVFAGVTDIPVMRLNFKTDVSKANLLSLRLDKDGTLTDAEVAAVKIYYDANNLGTFNRNNLAAYTLVTKTTATFGSDGQLNVALLDLQSNKQLDTAGRNYFVAIDLAPGAVIGRNMTIRVLNQSYVSVNWPNSVAATAFNSQLVTVMAPPQTLAVAFENKISSYVIQGQNSVLVASFTVSASSYTIDLSRIQVARGGTGFDSDLASLKLYKDDGDGVWEGIAAEQLLPPAAAFSGGVASFSPAVQTVAHPGSYTYYLVADISETAAAGRTFGLDFPAVGYFSVNDPHSVSNANFPFTGARATIQPTIDTMIVETVNAAPGLRQADSNKAMGRLRLVTDTRSATLSSIRFDKSGTTPDADITRIRLYRDNGNTPLALDAGDTLVGTLSSLAGGSGVMIISPAQSVTTTQADYFVTVDIATFAVVGTTFSLVASPAVVAPDTVYLNGTPLFTMAGTIQDNPDTVYLTFTNLATQSIYLGAANTRMAKIAFRADQDQALLTQLKLSFTGTAGPSDISAVRLYRDADGDGYFSALYDVQAATAALAAGEASFAFPGAGEVITASTKTYFALIDVSASATIGNSTALGVPSAASVFLAGTDIVADFTAKISEVATIRDPRIPTPPEVSLYRADNTLYSDVQTNFNPFRTMLKFRWGSTAGLGSVSDVRYYIGPAPADQDTMINFGISGGNSAVITARGLNLLNSGNYYLSVQTKNSLGAFYSDIVSRRFYVDTVAPALTSGELFTTSEGSYMLLNWNPASVGISGVQHYVVQERRGASPLWVSVSTTSDMYIPIIGEGGISPASLTRSPGVYYYRVYPVNNAGVEGSPSEPLAFNIGLERLSAISDESIFPNPFDSRKRSATIAFTLSQASRVEIKIYDIFGRPVRSIDMAGAAGVNTVTWDGANSSGTKVSKGMYIVLIQALGDKAIVKAGVIH